MRRDAPSPLVPGQPFRVTSWNIQYAGSRRLHFFYDGGRAVSVPLPLVQETLAGIAAELGEADIALVQEVDRGARRTAFVDELEALSAGFPNWASATYHKSRFVPSPSWEPLGRVDLRLAILPVSN